MMSAVSHANRTIRIVHLMRAPTALAFSVEGLAEIIRGGLRDFEFVVHRNRFHRPNPVGILIDGLRASLLRGDVLHITGDCSYLALFMPGRRTVVTIHDCGTLKRTTGIRRWLYKLLWMTLPLGKAGTVVAISDAVKQELVELASVSAHKIVVIHNAISPAFVEAPCLDPDARRSRPVLLQVGTTTNKNIERLAEALQGIDCHLEVIGRLSPSQSAALRRFRVSHSMRERLPTQDVIRAYQSCDAVVFASTNEGFGLPVLEAQACGKAVIASRIPAVIEVAGASGCLVDPLDVGSIRAGVLQVLGDPDYRRGLEERGRANVKRFGLDRFLSSHALLYRSIALESV
jgi:glycosyltransferase involved in cell wall biosynthesis